MGTKQQRLEEIREFFRLNKVEMAALMGIDQSYYGHILRADGKGNLRLEHLERLLLEKKVNPVWVLTGDGEMILGNSQDLNREGEPTEENVEALVGYVLGQQPTTLSVKASLMFKLACAQVLYENPGEQELRVLAMAARVYLRLITRNPEVNLVGLFDLDQQIKTSDQQG